MQRIWYVDTLSVLFGLGTWLCVNGLWVELPLLVRELPEQWNLPSYLSVVIQIANVGPLLYTLLNTYFPKHVTEKRAIYFVMLVGLVSTILLSLFWKKTGIVFESEHSTALLTLVFFLAAVDCCSRVTYLPFMARFNAVYLTSYFIGEGLSGFFPSIIALAQGVGGNPECRKNEFGNETIPFTSEPRFSVEVFFYTLFAFTLISCIAFYCMNNKKLMEGVLAHKSIDSLEGYVNKSATINDGASTSSSSTSTSTHDHSIFEPGRNPTRLSASTSGVADEGKGDNYLENNNDNFPNTSSTSRIDASESTLLVGISHETFIFLLGLQVVISMLSNGIFPSIQSFSCLPYGNVAYHLSVTLSNMANPTVCILAFCIPPPNKGTIIFATVLSFLLSGYVMATAVLSPKPPLVGQVSGEIILIVSWICLVALFTYVKVSVATLLRSKGKSGLFWCGVTTQFGSAVGAVAAFIVVNYTKIFEAYYPCT